MISLRFEFVTLALKEGANIAELCRRFAISRKTGYKWLERFEAGDLEALKDRSRRPQHMPRSTEPGIVQQVVALRAEHPAWGPRKLRRRLEDLGVDGLPAPSTIAEVLRREDCIAEGASLEHQPYRRFERSRPNELWQMDFKGHFALSRGGRCHPLSVLDDHSRFVPGLRACGGQTEIVVRPHLEDIFARYGLPEQMLCDHGPPWSGAGGEWTALGIWLLRLGIGVLHGRPYHPQTQGKEERFQRTLKAEVLTRTDLRDLNHSQEVFDHWRPIYNHQRPHEALGLATPATRYVPSTRSLPKSLPPIEYDPSDVIRPVKSKGEITWRNRSYYIGRGFRGQPAAIRATATDGLHEVFFCHQRLGAIDLRLPPAKSKHHYLPLLKNQP